LAKIHRVEPAQLKFSSGNLRVNMPDPTEGRIAPLATRARGGEAHRAEAAARHHGRSKCVQKKTGGFVYGVYLRDICPDGARQLRRLAARPYV